MCTRPELKQTFQVQLFEMEMQLTNFFPIKMHLKIKLYYFHSNNGYN